MRWVASLSQLNLHQLVNKRLVAHGMYRFMQAVTNPVTNPASLACKSPLYSGECQGKPCIAAGD